MECRPRRKPPYCLKPALFGMQAAEGAGRHPHLALEYAAEVALVRKAGRQRHLGQRQVGLGELAASLLDAQARR